MLSFISAQDDILPFVNQMVFLAPLILINWLLQVFSGDASRLNLT